MSSTIINRIEFLAQLGERVQKDLNLNDILTKAKYQNPWFTEENSKLSIQTVIDNYLNYDKLRLWVEDYDLEYKPRNVGVICAGNIPLVGWHDVMSIFVSGHDQQVKLSDKDTILMSYFINTLEEISSKDAPKIDIVQKLQNYEAVIATGSNNSAHYFEKYFGNVPHIIRKNRNAIAILDGNESSNDLFDLGKDIFTYFGLGCRNVSKLYIPKDYDLTILLESLHQFNDVIHHHKYKNNFDYNVALFLLNKEKYLNNGSIVLRKYKGIASRIASCNYEFYDDNESLKKEILSKKEEIQCIMSNVKNMFPNSFDFGNGQHPSLSDYADGVDTLQFLSTEVV